MYALHCLARKEVMAYEAAHPKSTLSPRVALRRASLASTTNGDLPNGNADGNGNSNGLMSPPKPYSPEIDLDRPTIPAIFTDPGYNLLGTSVLSTSNCGNPALRLFGFGPVTPEGYGIGGLFTFAILFGVPWNNRADQMGLNQAILSRTKGYQSACHPNTFKRDACSIPSKHISSKPSVYSSRCGKKPMNDLLPRSWTISVFCAMQGQASPSAWKWRKRKGRKSEKRF